MQKKLALIEPHHHSEVLRTFAQLFLHLGWQVNVLTNQQVKEDCYELETAVAIKWYIQQEEKVPQFINQQHSIINDCDLAIFVTFLSLDGLTIQLRDLKPKTILVIHNGNTFFAAKANFTLTSVLAGGLKNVARWLFFYLRNENQGRQRLLDSFDFLSWAAPSMSDYFTQQKQLPSHFDFIHPLPFAFFEGLPKEEKKGIKIGITGTIRGEGRDYKKVLLAFREMVPELQESVELTFLGGAQSKYAKDLLKAFQEIENDFFKIRYASDFITQKEFDKQLREVDFLILPLKKSYQLGIIREVYGHTNISGGINDMIRFGIPALISPHYPLSLPLQEMSERYDSANDLALLLSKWIKGKTFLKIREKVPELLASYQKEILARRLEKELGTIL